jgi:hypothetical protein
MADSQDLGDLIGGTLIEYLANCGFSREWRRATITDALINGLKVRIKTDGRPHFNTSNFDGFQLVKVGEVIYLIAQWPNYSFALAPKGVTIPTPDERGLNWNPFQTHDTQSA